MRVIALTVATTLALALAAPVRAAESAATMYRHAVAREAAARARLNSDTRHPAATLRAVRAVVADYEQIVLRHPRSGYCDNALWRGAQLSSAAFAFFGQARDRRTAVRLIHWLQTQYPSSRYAHRAPGAAPPPHIAPSPRRQAPRVAPPAAKSPEPEPAAPHGSGDTLLRGVTRSVLPGRVRIAIELTREALYEARRLTGPDRLVLDFEDTRPSNAMARARIDYHRAHVVKDVRVSRTDGNRTRVSIDLTGVTSYSTFVLYNPYRLVIDCRTPYVAGRPRPTHRAVPARHRAPAEIAAAPITTARALPTVPSHSAAIAAALAASDQVPAPPAAAAPVTTIARARPRLTIQPYPLAVRHKRPPPRRVPPPAEHVSPPTPSSTAGSHAAASDHVKSSAEVAASLAATAGPTGPSPRPPAADVGGGFSMARQLGLGVSRIVIDPGHGGRDPGAQANGLTEAHVVLDIALRLRRLLEEHGGFDVIMTRQTNVYVPLWKRTQIANHADADLFLSIHANASTDPHAHGFESFFLNFAANPEEAAVAARENATSGQSMGNLSDLIKTIALNNKLDESRDFASIIQRSMFSTLRVEDPDTRNLGVKQAPFDVLIGASMPSVLVEVSFLTNHQDAHYLKEASYRERIAEALYHGILRYQHSLKSYQTAENQ